MDTPDFRRAVVLAQQLLATESSGSTSATVTMPANTQVLVVVCEGGTGSPTVAVTGNLTGAPYPGTQLGAGVNTGSAVAYHFNVAAVADPVVTVTVTGGGAPSWWVYADHARHMVAYPGATAPPGPTTGAAGAASVSGFNIPAISVLALDGSGLTTVTLDSYGVNNELGQASIQWKPDGSMFAYVTADPAHSSNPFIRTCNNNGTGITTVFSATASDAWCVWDWWSDGSKLLCSYASQTGSDGRIFYCNPDGSGQVTILNDPAGTLIGGGYIAFCALSPDNSTVAFIGLDDTLRTVPVTGGASTIIVPNGPISPSPSGGPISWRPGAQIAWTIQGDDVYLINGNGTGLTTISTGTNPIFSACWSIPSTELLAVRFFGTENVWRLTTGGTLSTVAHDPHHWGGAKMSVR